MQNNLQINAKAAANPLARRRQPFAETPLLLPAHLPSGSGAGPSSAAEVGASGFSTSRHTPSPLGASSFSPLQGKAAETRRLFSLWFLVFPLRPAPGVPVPQPAAMRDVPPMQERRREKDPFPWDRGLCRRETSLPVTT